MKVKHMQQWNGNKTEFTKEVFIVGVILKHAHIPVRTCTCTHTYMYMYIHVCNYRILSSKLPSPCKHPPPLFDDPMVHEYMYALYIQIACLCKRPPPFFGCQFQAPMGAYSREYGTCIYMYI